MQEILLTEEEKRRMDEAIKEYGKALQAERERLKPNVDTLKKRLELEFPTKISQVYSNAVKLDFGHGYDISVFVHEDYPFEYTWNINEQYDNGVDTYCIGNVEDRYYSMLELIKFLNAIKDWL